MSLINTLKLVAIEKPTRLPVIIYKRNRLLQRIKEQADSVERWVEGQRYYIASTIVKKDKTSGEAKEVARRRLIKPWYWKSQDDGILLQIRYGAKVLELSKGCPTISIKSADELSAAFDTVKKAAEAGELDALIEDASTSIRNRFKKSRKR